MKDSIDLFVNDAVKLAKERRQALKRFLESEDGRVIVEWVRERFEVDLCCFQFQDVEMKRGYDALDAMRRDAYREVFLFLTCKPKAEDGEEGEEL